jgi:hypothetical protein
MGGRKYIIEWSLFLSSLASSIDTAEALTLTQRCHCRERPLHYFSGSLAGWRLTALDNVGLSSPERGCWPDGMVCSSICHRLAARLAQVDSVMHVDGDVCVAELDTGGIQHTGCLCWVCMDGT